ncbi:methyltransferase [Synoicihabitans lomoniglobus]|uniref:Methyltransferase n=1 Tax=Synoicihabitans lomoniglobus TaxID=2909285 RepID=A0AAF0I4M2_9BACT|nr:hypothetical protein [Opitutaceae bacterium LMO-M01]WED66913.1 methyltransferase [Opitutaceae bacterium LMO-M01]
MPINALINEPVSDPISLYRYRDGLAAVDLLAVAVAHLDLFTWLADNPSTLAAICQKFEIHPRPADVMMSLTTANGLTTLTGGVFLVTLRGREHLSSGSPWDMGPYFASMKDRPSTLAMLEVLRTNRPANFGSFDPQAWAQAMERPEFAKAFTAAMDCRGVLLGPAIARRVDLAERNAVLDIAGGSGIYACAMVANHANLRGAVLERAPVDRIARDSIAAKGYSDRVDVITGDMFADTWPTGFDVHLMSNVLHDWDEPKVRELLKKSYDALPVGGVLLLHHAYLNVEKTGPLHVAEFSALLMQITEGKCYSLGEMRSYLVDAGFQWGGVKSTAVSRSVIIAIKE